MPVMLNPEFTEAEAVADFLGPDRVVVGVIRDPDGHGVRTLRRVYHRVDAPIIVMRGVDACLSKLGANLFLATKISFANELARLCDAGHGGRVDEVVGRMAYDARIGGSFLKAGVGYGESGLPDQVTQTVRNAARIGVETPLRPGRRPDQPRPAYRSLVERLAELTVAISPTARSPSWDSPSSPARTTSARHLP